MQGKIAPIVPLQNLKKKKKKDLSLFYHNQHSIHRVGNCNQTSASESSFTEINCIFLYFYDRLKIHLERYRGKLAPKENLKIHHYFTLINIHKRTEDTCKFKQKVTPDH